MFIKLAVIGAVAVVSYTAGAHMVIRRLKRATPQVARAMSAGMEDAMIAAGLTPPEIDRVTEELVKLDAGKYIAQHLK